MLIWCEAAHSGVYMQEVLLPTSAARADFSHVSIAGLIGHQVLQNTTGELQGTT